MNSSSQPEADRCKKCGTRLDSNQTDDVCLGCALAHALDPQSPTDADTRTVVCDGSAGSTASPQGLSGKFGDYELLGEIARGGIGVVFKARQVSLDRLVAVKMLLFGPLASAADVQRFRTEAAAAASLQHPNIVAIHEVGFREGQHFLAMDYVAGPSLADLVSDGPLPARRAAGYMKIIAEAIQYAHERGVLHRDLKPSNVLIDEHDQPKVTDFGLAKRLEKDTELTLSGQVLGSPSYMAPEQAAAHRGLVGKRSDVYSLGALLYHLLTGRAPFAAPTVGETLHQVQNADPVSPTVLTPGLSRDLKTICLKCLEKEPARRYQTARELADDLGRFLDNKPILARPVGQPAKVWRWCRRKPVVASLVAATVLAILAGFIGVSWQGRRAIQARDAAQRRLYAAQMTQAYRAWDLGNLNVARALLNGAHQAQPGQIDPRGADWRWLWFLCQGEQQAVLRTQGEWQILAAEVSPDGRRVATAGWSTNIVIYDLASGRALKSLVGHARVLMSPGSLAFSPDGRRLASASGGLLQPRGPCEFYLWDLDTMNKTVLEGHELWLWAVAFSSDGRWLASACMDGTIGLWDADTGRKVALLPAHQKAAYAVAFSQDSQWLFSGGEDGVVREWDVMTGREAAPPLIDEAPVRFIAVAPDARMIATATIDDSLRLWDRTSRRVRKLRYGPAEPVLAPAFSPDGRLLAFGTGNNIRLWDLETEEEKKVLRGSAGLISSLRFLPDGRHLVSASEMERPMLWDLNRPEKVATLRGFREGVMSLAVSADQRLLVAGSCDFGDGQRPGEVIVFDLATQQPLLPPLEHPEGVKSLSLTADGKRLATGSPGGAVRIFTMPDGRLLQTLTNAVTEMRGNLVFSPDGQTLVTSRPAPSQVVAWDTATWTARPLLRNPVGPPQNLAFSPDGTLLAVPLGVGKLAIVLNMPGGTTNTIIPSNIHARGAAFSPDGAMFAIHTFVDIHLFKVKNWKPLGTLKGHGSVIEKIAFAPDGKTLASVGVEGPVRLWSVPVLAEVAVLYDHRGPTQTVAFTSDGQWLITGSRDKTVKLRKIPTFEEIRVVEQRERAEAEAIE